MCDFKRAGRLKVFGQDKIMSDFDFASGTETGAKAGTSARPLRILIVDDNKSFAETLSWVLEGMGDTVETVHNGPNALDAVQAFNPDIVFLDIVLPVMDGYEVCRQMRAQFQNPALKIIAQSGYGDTASEALKRGACFDAHLTKPLDLRQVIKVISDIRWNRFKPEKSN